MSFLIDEDKLNTIVTQTANLVVDKLYRAVDELGSKKKIKFEFKATIEVVEKEQANG